MIAHILIANDLRLIVVVQTAFQPLGVEKGPHTMPKQAPNLCIVISGLVTSLALLAGCSSADSGTTETVATTDTAQSGTMIAPTPDDATATAPAAAPATFDRNDPNFEFFNICEELTEEDFASLGLEYRGDPLVELGSPSSTCSFRDLGGFPDEFGIQHATVNMGGLSEEELLSKVIEIQTEVSSQAQGLGAVFFVQSDDQKDESCEISAPTAGGRLWVGYGTVRSEVMTQDEICQKAFGYFGKFYQKVKEEL